ncbi:MAG TPA: hypothetical protein VLM76_13455 [Patescibacteria group bacterium]|nr:hypothetical protein [Patescibacteria group bacterium]
MTENAITIAERPGSLDLTLLKAIGLDRAAPEQRQLAMAIAERYGLDLMLKHLVLIEGRPYVTRDALLHIAHRSGQFDGIQTTTPEIVGDEWRATATVWRKDMSHPFVYGGRYPTKGGNQRFAPEMCLKVAESMALRRAFDVSAPVMEERWDVEEREPLPPRPTLAEVAASKAAAIEAAEHVEARVDLPDSPVTVTDGIVNAIEAAEVPPAGLSAVTLAALARGAGRTKGQLALAIGALGRPVPTPLEVTAVVTALSDEERGRLADELNLDWRAP